MTEKIIRGRDAVIYTTIGVTSAVTGFATGYSVSTKATVIKDYQNNSVQPAIVASGNVSYTFTLDKFYTTKSWQNIAGVGTSFNMSIQPSGASGGKIVLTGIVLTDVTDKGTQAGVVLETIAGESATATFQ